MFASFPKIEQKFQDTLSQIIPKMVQTVDHFDILHPKYVQLQEMFEQIIADPREIQHQESILRAQEDVAHRQKEDWKAFIEMFRSGILPEIKEVLQMQQQNPNIHTQEKSRILAYEQESKKAFEAAKNAGNGGQYEEGRIHLQKIKGILTRLKRFPNGVHAQKLKSLKNIADTWNTAQANMEYQLNILKETITKAILEEGVEVSQEKTIHPLFETLNKQLNKTNTKLMSELEKYKKAVHKLNLDKVETKEELQMKNASYVAEVQSRLQYQNTMNGIINIVQERCRDVRLVEDVLALYDDCEAKAGVDGEMVDHHADAPRHNLPQTPDSTANKGAAGMFKSFFGGGY